MEAGMKIKLLGSGCSKCKALEENVKQALMVKGIEATLEKIVDDRTIVRHGVMKTPALVIDDCIKFSGRVASVDDIMKMLS
jgi:small redox-active disulfide protein 2